MNVMVIFGGCSSEYSISLQSAAGVLDCIDRTAFTPIPVGISKEGDWYYYSGETAQIRADNWQTPALCRPALLRPDRRAHALVVFEADGLREVPIDIVFPVLHGRNGEDGTIQGLCQLAGLPLAGCGVLASALCMDKDRAHKLAAAAGVSVPRSHLIAGDMPADAVAALAREIGYPLFVKPVRAGSSHGVARVAHTQALPAAVADALSYDTQVLLEAAVPGFEVGCAVMGNDALTLGTVDEIELSGGFFDFTEKYQLLTSKIHVPARVSAAVAIQIQQTAATIYRALGCSGFARVDMFLTPEGEIVFNEVNTIPGFTPHSRFPNMLRAVGLSFEEVLSRILQLALEEDARA